MQPFRLLQRTLEQAPAGRYLFTAGDFSPLFPDLSVAAPRQEHSQGSHRKIRKEGRKITGGKEVTSGRGLFQGTLQ
ncbi:hypothetical protein AGMMS49579_19970 [Spirochaetia bacterium]|nr:hypothetical protein AGMMS49579_19970 [Spirochaetia bacterium]